ncbi:uncharacterized protein V6R79_013135 [Siganus canaliculatus]
MEHYVYGILSAVAQAELDSVPRDELEDILVGADLYNQAVWERAQHSTVQWRTAVLRQAHYSSVDCSLPNSKRHHPTAFSAKELTTILALHHANMTAVQLQGMTSDPSHVACECSHSSGSQVAGVGCWASPLNSEWTWEKLQHAYLNSLPLSSSDHHPALQSSSLPTCHKTTVYMSDLQLESANLDKNCPVFSKPTSVQQGTEASNKEQSAPVQSQTTVEVPVQPHPEECKASPGAAPPSGDCCRQWAAPLSGLCQQNDLSAEVLLHLLVSSRDVLSLMPSYTSPPEAPADLQTVTDVSSDGKTATAASAAPAINTVDLVELNGLDKELNTDQHKEGNQQEGSEMDTAARTGATISSGLWADGDPEKEALLGVDGTRVEPDGLQRTHSVQWLDLEQSLVFADLWRQYHTLLWRLCSSALWLQLHVPAGGDSSGSINLQESYRGFQILPRISQASEADVVPKECRAMLEDLTVNLLAATAHVQWDYVLCRGLGSALRDKCILSLNHSSSCEMLSSEQDGGVMTSVTTEHFLMLFPPLLTSLDCHRSSSKASVSCSLLPSRLTLQRHTVSLALATAQLSTVWVMSKAYQFLASWSLNRFLLITQGDLHVLKESLELILQQTKSLVSTSDGEHHSALHIHGQLQLRQQLEDLDRTICSLQTFSALMLKTFSRDCKKMSGEIFEQTMPSAVHWRPSLRTGFPCSPSEYASLAAQTVIGQVLEGVAPLSEDVRVQALSITMTAFMEAWMEHILRQKIKFSVQGALQLKQDFDSIRELIQSDRYGLSAELHQRLLSLRVFQQVDSAVVCLLQQPHAKPYLQARAWDSIIHCCPANASRDSIDAVEGSITSLGYMECDGLTPADPAVLTTDLPPVDPATPGEPYLAPSLALGASQQEWLNLRIHSSTRRWRLPGLHCLSKSEP